MNPATYEMEGSLPFIPSPTYELGSNNQIDSYNIEILRNELPTYSFNSHLDLDVTQWPQRSSFRPVYRAELATGHTLNPSCSFRSEILDDCAGARFYARALEFYLLEDEHQSADFNCPYAACTAQYKNPKSMLRHLKHCKNFSLGKFWCPTCCRYESFKLRSGERCSWDKEDLREKIVQKYKSVVQNVSRGFGGSNSVSQQKSNRALCATCSAQLPNIWMQCDGNTAPFDQPQIAPPAKHIFPLEESATPSGQIYEASPTEASELSGVHEVSELYGSSSESSPSQCYPQQELTHVRSVSELSSAFDSPNGSSISNSVSPSSSTREEISPTTRRHNFANILDKASHRDAKFYSEADTSNYIMDQRYTSLYRNASTSHSLQVLTPASNASNLGDFAASSTLPTLTQHPSFRNTPPTLRLETSPNLVAPIADVEMLFCGGQVFGHDSTRRELRVSSLPTRIICTQPDMQQPNAEQTLFGSFTSGDDPFAAQQLESPSNNQSPPISAISIPNSNPQSPHTGLLSDQGQRECHLCGKTFKEKAYLNKHLKTHGERDSIPCPQCDKFFTRKDNLTVHLKRLHGHFSPKRRRDSSDSLESAPQSKKKDIRAEG
ncbi:hypothetical protein GGR58DRAFT_396863 [Xylaria digitata]|nr:hypothetical protein GGR58DRAFT_396863 [Xylaria digitata]